MDAAITAAALALRAGDPLAALQRVALRDDADALALRGIAMAQLGELASARELLLRAVRAFGPRAELPRARCWCAAAEVALAARDLAWSERPLLAALRTFIAHGDRANEAHARLLLVRRTLLLGRVDAAAEGLEELGEVAVSRQFAAIAALVAYEIALRRGRALQAREALAAARAAATASGLGALCAEIERAAKALELPAAQTVVGGKARSLALAEVEELLAAPGTIVDGCRRIVRCGDHTVRLARRPVLFALAEGLALAWPDAAIRSTLIARAFGVRRPDDSHRARLRVEIGRLRRLLARFAAIRATENGFALAPLARGIGVRVLTPPIDSPAAAVLALLADGEAWSTSSLALALGDSQRTVQRALLSLLHEGQVRARGRGRAQRWLAAPIAGFATCLLLPGADAID